MQKIKADDKYRKKENINAIEVTDGADGKTSILKLASSEDHVEMSTGRTLREEYMGVLKTMGKEFVSTDGSPITVNNGIEARVISGEIKGQTVKNYALSTQSLNFTKGSGKKIPLGANISINTQFNVAFNISDVVGSCTVNIYGASVGETITTKPISSTVIKQNGFYILDFGMTTKDITKEFMFYIANAGTSTDFSATISNIAVLESAISSPIPFGLSSTQAIISNNGKFYPIYASEEDKANKKVISLGSTPTKKDTLEIKDDGSAIYTQNTKDADDGSTRVDLSTPIVVHIDKSLVPTILTKQMNTIDTGSAVKASSFSITVPTTDGIKKEYNLTPINGWTGTAKANLLKTGDVELVLDLTIPSTFNTLICSLPEFVRPKAERTVLGYNDNTPIVVKIGTDGTVKLPVSATGTVKLNDTYKL